MTATGTIHTAVAARPGMGRGPSIGCVVQAHDAEASIAAVLEELLARTRVPEVIHVVVSDSSDATVRIASQFAGRHSFVSPAGTQSTEVFVHDVGDTPRGRDGAQEYGHTLVEGFDVVLSIDGDTAAGVVARMPRRRSARWLHRFAVLTLLAAALSVCTTLVRRQHGHKV